MTDAKALVRDQVSTAVAPCVTSSFQAECVVLCTPPSRGSSRHSGTFLDTVHHFPETYEYRDWLAQRWGLNLVTLRAPAPSPGLWRQNTHECCAVHKVGPLFAALEEHDVWFTGLRREQSASRSSLAEVEPFTLASGRCCGRSVRSPCGLPRTSGTTRRRTTSRCCPSTTEATRALVASRVPRCRWIDQTQGRGAGVDRSWNAALLLALAGPSIEASSVAAMSATTNDPDSDLVLASLSSSPVRPGRRCPIRPRLSGESPRSSRRRGHTLPRHARSDRGRRSGRRRPRAAASRRR